MKTYVFMEKSENCHYFMVKKRGALSYPEILFFLFLHFIFLDTHCLIEVIPVSTYKVSEYLQDFFFFFRNEEKIYAIEKKKALPRTVMFPTGKQLMHSSR